MTINFNGYISESNKELYFDNIDNAKNASKWIYSCLTKTKIADKKVT